MSELVLESRSARSQAPSPLPAATSFLSRFPQAPPVPVEDDAALASASDEEPGGMAGSPQEWEQKERAEDDVAYLHNDLESPPPLEGQPGGSVWQLQYNNSLSPLPSSLSNPGSPGVDSPSLAEPLLDSESDSDLEEEEDEIDHASNEPNQDDRVVPDAEEEEEKEQHPYADVLAEADAAVHESQQAVVDAPHSSQVGLQEQAVIPPPLPVLPEPGAHADASSVLAPPPLPPALPELTADPQAEVFSLAPPPLPAVVATGEAGQPQVTVSASSRLLEMQRLLARLRAEHPDVCQDLEDDAAAEEEEAEEGEEVQQLRDAELAQHELRQQVLREQERLQTPRVVPADPALKLRRRFELARNQEMAKVETLLAHKLEAEQRLQAETAALTEAREEELRLQGELREAARQRELAGQQLEQERERLRLEQRRLRRTLAEQRRHSLVLEDIGLLRRQQGGAQGVDVAAAGVGGLPGVAENAVAEAVGAAEDHGDAAEDEDNEEEDAGEDPVIRRMRKEQARLRLRLEATIGQIQPSLEALSAEGGGDPEVQVEDELRRDLAAADPDLLVSLAPWERPLWLAQRAAVRLDDLQLRAGLGFELLPADQRVYAQAGAGLRVNKRVSKLLDKLAKQLELLSKRWDQDVVLERQKLAKVSDGFRGAAAGMQRVLANAESFGQRVAELGTGVRQHCFPQLWGSFANGTLEKDTEQKQALKTYKRLLAGRAQAAKSVRGAQKLLLRLKQAKDAWLDAQAAGRPTQQLHQKMDKAREKTLAAARKYQGEVRAANQVREQYRQHLLRMQVLEMRRLQALHLGISGFLRLLRDFVERRAEDLRALDRRPDTSVGQDLVEFVRGLLGGPEQADTIEPELRYKFGYLPEQLVPEAFRQPLLQLWDAAGLQDVMEAERAAAVIPAEEGQPVEARPASRVPLLLTKLTERLAEPEIRRTPGLFRDSEALVAASSALQVDARALRNDIERYNCYGWVARVPANGWPHVLAAVLLGWLRSLGEPIIPTQVWEDCAAALREASLLPGHGGPPGEAATQGEVGGLPEEDADAADEVKGHPEDDGLAAGAAVDPADPRRHPFVLTVRRRVLPRLPALSRAVLVHLLGFCAGVLREADHNESTPAGLAEVFAPVVLRSPEGNRKHLRELRQQRLLERVARAEGGDAGNDLYDEDDVVVDDAAEEEEEVEVGEVSEPGNEAEQPLPEPQVAADFFRELLVWRAEIFEELRLPEIPAARLQQLKLVLLRGRQDHPQQARGQQQGADASPQQPPLQNIGSAPPLSDEDEDEFKDAPPMLRVGSGGGDALPRVSSTYSLRLSPSGYALADPRLALQRALERRVAPPAGLLLPAGAFMTDDYRVYDGVTGQLLGHVETEDLDPDAGMGADVVADGAASAAASAHQAHGASPAAAAAVVTPIEPPAEIRLPPGTWLGSDYNIYDLEWNIIGRVDMGDGSSGVGEAPYDDCWEVHTDAETGVPFYFNSRTGESSWYPPQY